MRSQPSTRSAARRARELAAAVAVAVLAFGCARGRERLVVAAVRQPATALYLLARDSGCLAREGLDVQDETFELGRDALSRMRQDRADVAIAFETPTLAAAAADARVRVLSALHTSTSNTRLVARADRGIGRFQDLRGARVGLARGSNAEFFVDLVLRFGGVARGDVTVVDLTPDASVSALARGDLDAAVLSDPYAGRAEEVLGAGARVIRTELYTEISLLLTREDVLRGREGALRKLLRGLACAERLARGRPGEALRLVRPRFAELSDDELRREVARVRWGLGLDHVLLGALRDEAEWLHARRGPGAGPDLRQLVARGPLEAVDPDAVMLLPTEGAAP